MTSECHLATLPAADPQEQVVVVLIQGESGSQVVLRQQSWGEGLGWFTQKSLVLEPQQLAQLKGVLGHSNASAANFRSAEAARSVHEKRPGSGRALGVEAYRKAEFRLVLPESA